MKIFYSHTDVKRFATDQLEGSIIERWEFEQGIDELVDLIIGHPDFKYGEDCQPVLDYLWDDGGDYWPIGNNLQSHCPHCKTNVTKYIRDKCKVGFVLCHLACPECGINFGGD